MKPATVQYSSHPKRSLAAKAGLGLLLLHTSLFPCLAADDWVSVSDPQDMADSSGDIRSISARVKGDNLYLSMTVESTAAPSTAQTPVGMNNRYYYHWLLDTDNNPATGRSNAEYEGSPTGVTKPIGAERILMIGWRDGIRGGVEIYDPANEDVALATNFTFQATGNTLTAIVPLTDLGLAAGQTIAFSAFQEGSSDGWAVDWMESATLTLSGLPLTEATVKDPAEMADTSGDIRAISAHVEGSNLLLSMTVEGTAAPSTEQTPVGMNNRYYYHWLLDTDNNPATGRSNAEYEGSPTGVTKPIGAERILMIGWRDGIRGGVEVYDPANEDVALATNFTFQASGNTLTAVVPLEVLGLTLGQTIAFSAFQEGSSDGWAVDWVESQTLTLAGPAMAKAVVPDPAEMADTSGDIRAISAHVEGSNLLLSMTVEGTAAPSTEQTPVGMNNRYYYHWLLDTDNNPATGRSNAEYEGSPTGVTKPIGAERILMIGWRDGIRGGVEVYDPANEDVALATNFTFQASGNTLTAVVPLEVLGLTIGQTIAISAFQEGSSDGWAVDWIESQVLTLTPPSAGRMKIDGSFTDWSDAASLGLVTSVDDPQDLADSSGDIRQIQATVEGGYLYLRMSVQGIALPSVDQTPEGKANRYYYHWLLDTDNNPATGRSNGEYEGAPTGVTKPIGSERIVQLGWKDGAPNGLEVYDPANENVAIVSNFEYAATNDSVELRLKMSDIGLVLGQTIAISAFQEGASDGWAVDWMESKALTLNEAGSTSMTLENTFAGNAYSFTITVKDDTNMSVDPATVVVRVDGTLVSASVNKAGGVTTITYVYPELMAVGARPKISLSLLAGGKPQAKDNVYTVEPYSVLGMTGSLKQVNQSNAGFVARVAQVSSVQSGIPCVHSNLTDLAELQLSGSLTNELVGGPYYNEVESDISQWIVEPVVMPGTINWFELAPDVQVLLNFPNDEPFPKLLPGNAPNQGVVVELTTYLQLPAGSHKFGVYTEGGYCLYAGLTNHTPVLNRFDATDGEVPTYYSRNHYLDVVATEDGFYPVRILWFQSGKNQEPGLMLELYTVQDQKMHLVNDTSDSKSIRAYRAGSMVGNGSVTTPVVATSKPDGLQIQYTGMLQWAESPAGPWYDYADASQSPVKVPMDSPSMFFRSRSY